MRILSFDPGGTTGWALWEGNGDRIGTGYNFGQMGPGDHHLQLQQFVEQQHSGKDFQVVCESFEYRQNQDRTTVSLVSVEYIGVLKLIEQDRSYTFNKVVWQTAAKGKAFWTDDKIKKLGLWWPGHKHAMDALRHLLYYRAFELGDKDLFQKLK